MKLEILQIGSPILRTPARALTIEEIQSATIQQLIELMKVTMREAPGVGLAAPQIGESIQLIVIEDRIELIQNLNPEQIAARERRPVDFHVLINPRITFKDQQKVTFFEGCLSFAGFMGQVPRAIAVQVECLNEHAEHVTIDARGWYARILQHEIEHLHGKLCVDHMNMQSLTSIENYAKYWRDAQ